MSGMSAAKKWRNAWKCFLEFNHSLGHKSSLTNVKRNHTKVNFDFLGVGELNERIPLVALGPIHVLAHQLLRTCSEWLNQKSIIKDETKFSIVTNKFTRTVDNQWISHPEQRGYQIPLIQFPTSYQSSWSRYQWRTRHIIWSVHYQDYRIHIVHNIPMLYYPVLNWTDLKVRNTVCTKLVQLRSFVFYLVV